jgi:hypothetical protein
VSVLSVPRIFFKGQMAWDPATMNNNDQWPTYDFVRAMLNWDFLATQLPPITPANAEQLFPTWAQTLQPYNADPPPGWYEPPAEWNYYGGNACALHSPTAQTFVTGGQAGLGGPVVTEDPLVGAIVDLVGDPFPGTTFATEARLVDTNPAAFWSTSFFLRTLLVGDQSGPGQYLSGDVAPGTLMSNRWMFLQRNLNLDNELEIAGVAGGVIQACLPNDTLAINASGSQLLDQLDAARSGPGVDGVMVRMSIYMTQYFTGPEFDGCTGITEQYTALVNRWADDLSQGRAPLQNPAVSLVVGAIGLWMDGELVSVPGGRYLAPAACVPVQGLPPADPQTVAFGPAVAEVNLDAGYVTLDLTNAVPELDSSGQKADCGSLSVVLTDPDGNATTLGTIEPGGYGQAAYEATAGIVDIQLVSGVTTEQLANGSLSIVAVTSSGTPTTALVEAPITVQTDARALWVDQGATGAFTIQVRQNGAAPTDTVSVLLQQYLPTPPPPAANASAWVLPSSSQPEVVSFDNAPGNVVTLPPSAGGIAEVQFTPLAPGFPAIVFFPFVAGQPVPQPPAQVAPVFVPGAPPPSITTAFYSTARVMPFDNSMPLAFADLWDSTHDPGQAWAFVYENILGLYSLLFPVMKYYGSLDLGSQAAVDQNIALLLQLTDGSMAGSSVYMPVTRDLSAGKRQVLEMYGWLVEQGWPNEPVPVPQAGRPS